MGLNKLLEDTNTDKIANKKLEIRFKNGDLKYSIHKATIILNGKKNKKGKWEINCKLDNKYDFTEWFTKNKSVIEVEFGDLANDFAHIAQNFGFIKPFNIVVDFNIQK